MNFGNPAFGECEVAVLGGQSRVDAGDVGREPDAMAVRHEFVLLAVPELNRHADRVELEAPGSDEGEVVVDPSVHARTDPDGHVIEQKGRKLTGNHRAIGGT